MSDTNSDLYNSTVDSNILTFCINSGCTDHMVNDKKYFSSLLMLKKPIKIAVAKESRGSWSSSKVS